MSRPIEDIGARAAAALTHPLRIAILWALEEGPASPSELARRIDARLEAVSYHARKLHEVGIIEADAAEMLEGNVRHPYRLASKPWITAEAWEGLSTAQRDSITHAVLRRAWRMARGGLQHGGWHRPDSHISRVALQLDGEGFQEVSEIIVDAMQRIEDAEARADLRIQDADAARLDSTLVVLLFETPSVDVTRGIIDELYAYRDGDSSQDDR